jgi:hypothetical protein
MALIPLSVLVFVVMVAFGGPEPFARVVATLANDAVAHASRWLRQF